VTRDEGSFAPRRPVDGFVAGQNIERAEGVGIEARSLDALAGARQRGGARRVGIHLGQLNGTVEQTMPQGGAPWTLPRSGAYGAAVPHEVHPGLRRSCVSGSQVPFNHEDRECEDLVQNFAHRRQLVRGLSRYYWLIEASYERGK